MIRACKGIRWRIEYDCRELRTGRGLCHFEARSWTGFPHDHATLVAAAHLFLTEERLAGPKAPGAA